MSERPPAEFVGGSFTWELNPSGTWHGYVHDWGTEIVPGEDSIEHSPRDCVCQPKVKDEDGSRLLLHSSLTQGRA